MSRPKTLRTSIDDLSVVGDELFEEHLQLAFGGRPLVGTCIAVCTYYGPGAGTCSDEGVD